MAARFRTSAAHDVHHARRARRRGSAARARARRARMAMLDTGLPRDSRAAGLSAAEARARLAADGPNVLPRAERRTVVAIVLGVLREPMFLLLIAASTLYLLLGDAREALVLAASIVVVFAITVLQERRAERALEALRDLSAPRARVIRDGVEQRIAGADVVRGDLLVLTEGDRVAADARVTAANDLNVDESLLTGESLPLL